MDKKDTAVLVGLLATILLLTGTVTGATPRSPVLAALAPILALAFMTWYLIVLIINREEVIAALAAILLSRHRAQPTKANILVTIVSYGILICLALFFLSSGIPQRLASGLAGIIMPSSTGTQTQQPPVINPIAGLFPTGPIVYYGTFVFFAIFVISFFILIQGFRLAIQNRGAALSEEESEVELKQDVVGVVQQAITSLRATKEYHDIILQCYQQMCTILSHAGIEPSPSETAREFAEDMSLKLRVGSNAVQGLTFLFEEARYSDHQITEQKRIMALQHLDSLQQALSANVGLGT